MSLLQPMYDHAALIEDRERLAAETRPVTVAVPDPPGLLARLTAIVGWWWG